MGRPSKSLPIVNQPAAPLQTTVERPTPAKAGNDEMQPDVVAFLDALRTDAEDPFFAAQKYERWLADPLVSSTVQVRHSPENDEFDIQLGPPESEEPYWDKMNSLAALCSIATHNSDFREGATYVFIRHLCSLGKSSEAKAVLELALSLRTRPGSLLEGVELVFKYRESGEPVPAHLEDVLGESNYFDDKFCERPFREFQISGEGHVKLCCGTWMRMAVGNIRSANFEDVLNSPIAQRVRESILDASFRYCNRTTCSLIKNNGLARRRDVRDPEVLENMRTGNGKVKRARSVTIGYDATCNLACPQCRTKKVVEKGPALEWKIEATRRVVIPLLRTADTVLMNGFGDIWMSRPCQMILDATRDELKDLKLKLLTNGVLLDERRWAQHRHIHKNLEWIRISVDAVREQTYDKIRRLGNFDKLCTNLEHLSKLRAQGVIPAFYMSMVYQVDNLDEMEDFAHWGLQLGCDIIVFESLEDWGTFGRAQYLEKAVHLPQHPRYADFREIIRRPVFRDPRCSRDWA